jgi:hypothetical protein
MVFVKFVQKYYFYPEFMVLPKFFCTFVAK